MAYNVDMERYKRSTKLGKTFILLSLLLIIFLIATYSWFVYSAFHEDPRGCMYDSWIRQACEHPFSNSVGWSIIYFIFVGWVLYIPWLVAGSLILIKRVTIRQMAKKHAAS